MLSSRKPIVRTCSFNPVNFISSQDSLRAIRNPTWNWYKSRTGNKNASRANFQDVTDFIGWYSEQSKKMLGIPKNDFYNQYLAYHEGWNGFRKKTYKKKPELLKTASKVEKQAQTYNKQLSKCMSKLDRNKYILF